MTDNHFTDGTNAEKSKTTKLKPVMKGSERMNAVSLEGNGGWERNPSAEDNNRTQNFRKVRRNFKRHSGKPHVVSSTGRMEGQLFVESGNEVEEESAKLQQGMQPADLPFDGFVRSDSGANSVHSYSENGGRSFYSRRTSSGASFHRAGSASEQPPSLREELSKTNIYIGGLESNVDSNMLADLCKEYGEIVSSKAIVDKNTNECRGYGFVMFLSPEAAAAAVEGLTNKGMQVSFAKETYSERLRTLADYDSTNLYMANLPIQMVEQQLEAMLSPFGKIVSSRILRDHVGVSRGVGFARFESREVCEAIIYNFDGAYLPGCIQPLQCRFADSTWQRKMKHQYSDTRKAKMLGRDMGVANMAALSSMGDNNTIMAVRSYGDPNALGGNPSALMMPPMAMGSNGGQRFLPMMTATVPPGVNASSYLASMYSVPSNSHPSSTHIPTQPFPANDPAIMSSYSSSLGYQASAADGVSQLSAQLQGTQLGDGIRTQHFVQIFHPTMHGVVRQGVYSGYGTLESPATFQVAVNDETSEAVSAKKSPVVA